jgi:hypothetical protein
MSVALCSGLIRIPIGRRQRYIALRGFMPNAKEPLVQDCWRFRRLAVKPIEMAASPTISPWNRGDWRNAEPIGATLAKSPPKWTL